MTARRPAQPPAPPPWWGEPVRRAAPDGSGAPLLRWPAEGGWATAPPGARPTWPGGPAPLRRSWRFPRPFRRATFGARSGGTPLRTAVLLGFGLLVLALVVVLADRTTAGVAPVATPFLTYTPPPGWSTAPPDAAATTDAPTLVGVVHGPRYACGGEVFLRGFAAAALLPTDTAAGPVDRAERVARWFAATAYPAADGTPPEVTVAPPRPVRVPGPTAAVEGTITEATVQPPDGGGDCGAAAGRVLVLAVPHDGGAAVLLVAGDTAGGPADPAPPDRSALDAVVASARLPAA